MSAKVVDLDALASPARQAGVSVGGTVYPVSPIRHADAHRIAVAMEKGENVEISAAMANAARNAVPTMPSEVFDGLTIDGVSAIVGIARAGVDFVSEMIAEQQKASSASEGAPGNA